MTYLPDPPDPGTVTCPNCGAKDEPCDYWCADLVAGNQEWQDEFPEEEDHDVSF